MDEPVVPLDKHRKRATIAAGRALDKHVIVRIWRSGIKRHTGNHLHHVMFDARIPAILGYLLLFLLKRRHVKADLRFGVAVSPPDGTGIARPAAKNHAVRPT